MRPRLRPHAQVTRQIYRGRRWHVLHDPASNQFYRLDPVSYEWLGLLDGTRSVEEAWLLTLRKHADAAPTQPEVLQLLAQLYGANLLAGDASPEAEQLLRRGRERLKKKAVQKALGVMYFKTRLVNPDAFLSWIEPILRPVLNRWGLLAWAALVLAALWQALPHAGRIREGLPSAMDAGNWGWLLAGYAALKLLHELGHGVLCKRFGGEVPELGVMLLVLMPSPYVDASSCWAFPDKWKRIAVGAGGMIFELAAASVAVFVWLGSAEGTLVNRLAFNAVLTAGVSTVLFNANPLLRFDGYYILSDLIGVPNLMQRSNKMLQFIAQRTIYRLREARPPTNQPGERAVLAAYGVLSLAYRVALFVTITLFVMGQFFAVGLVLAVWTAAAWFIVPLGTFAHWLATSPQIAEHRGRAVLTTLALAAAIVGLLGLAPAPDHRRALGVAEGVRSTGVFVGAAGVVSAAHARPGDRVSAGQPLLTLESPELKAQLALTEAQLREERVREMEAAAQSEAAGQIIRQRVAALEEQLARLRERQGRLVVRAPHDGVVVGSDPIVLLGARASEGTPVCDVVDPSSVRVAAGLTQAQASWLFELPPDRVRVSMRRHADPGVALAGGAVRVVEAGQRRLPHGAMAAGAGGPAEVDPTDAEGRRALRPVFTAYVEPPAGAGLLPGERVAVRFTLPDAPLLRQWFDRLHRALPDINL
jgi:putative peptide zinc metalloprotease protein